VQVVAAVAVGAMPGPAANDGNLETLEGIETPSKSPVSRLCLAGPVLPSQPKAPRMQQLADITETPYPRAVLAAQLRRKGQPPLVDLADEKC
jgi:hypothetical protein